MSRKYVGNYLEKKMVFQSLEECRQWLSRRQVGQKIVLNLWAYNWESLVFMLLWHCWY